MENKSTNAKWRKIQNVKKAVTEGDLTVGPADGIMPPLFQTIKFSI